MGDEGAAAAGGARTPTFIDLICSKMESRGILSNSGMEFGFSFYIGLGLGLG